jgi:hypothetical protein
MIAAILLTLAATPSALDRALDVTGDMDDFCVPFMRPLETVETVRAQMVAKGLKPGAGNAFTHGDRTVQVSESRDGLRVCSISIRQSFEAVLTAAQRWPSTFSLTQLQKEPGFYRWEGTRYFLSVSQGDGGEVAVTFTKKRG